MTRKIIQIGSSAAITLPPDFLKALGVSVGDGIELGLNETKDVVSVRAVKKETNRQKQITALTLGFVERYRKDLEALAD